MFSPKDMRQWLAVLKQDIAEINFAEMVIDDSQMTNNIGQRPMANNLLLYGVLPDYAADTRTDDALMMQSGFDFLLLKKARHSDLNLTVLMDDMQEVFEAMQKLLARTLQEMRDPSTCGLFYYLDENSVQINPVWGKAGTNGYMMSLNLRTPE